MIPSILVQMNVPTLLFGERARPISGSLDQKQQKEMCRVIFGMTRGLMQLKKIFIHKLDAADNAQIQLQTVCAYKRTVVVPM